MDILNLIDLCISNAIECLSGENRYAQIERQLRPEGKHRSLQTRRPFLLGVTLSAEVVFV